MNIPNILSIARIILIPLNVLALFKWPLWAFIIIFLITALSDFFDGFLARRWGQATTTGAILDILADRLLIIGLYLAVAVKFNIEPLYIALILFRDIIVFIGRIAVSILYDVKNAQLMVPAQAIGKATTVMQLVLIGVIVLGLRSAELIYLTIGLSATSGFYYIYKGVRTLLEPRNK